MLILSNLNRSGVVIYSTNVTSCVTSGFGWCHAMVHGVLTLNIPSDNGWSTLSRCASTNSTLQTLLPVSLLVFCYDVIRWVMMSWGDGRNTQGCVPPVPPQILLYKSYFLYHFWFVWWGHQSKYAMGWRWNDPKLVCRFLRKFYSTIVIFGLGDDIILL